MSILTHRQHCKQQSTLRSYAFCDRRLEQLEPRVVLDSTVVFNEIMFNPAGEDASAEWLELHNQNAIDMDISGWRIDGGVRFDIPAETIIPGGGYLVVAKDPTAFEAATGVTGAMGPFSGNLSNGGEELRLLNNFRSFFSRQQSALPTNFWSVDLQGIGGSRPNPGVMSGADSQLGIGNQWNQLDTDVHPGVAENPDVDNLRNHLGQETGVGFSISGTVSGFVNGTDPLTGDSIFVGNGNADQNVDWQITGLNAGTAYDLFLFNGDVRFRDAHLKVDVGGDGDFDDETILELSDDGFLVEDIAVSGAGTIAGQFLAGNWSGFHLIDGGFPDTIAPPITGSGGNKGRRIMDRVRYDDNAPWPVSTDGSGLSLAKIDKDSGSAHPENWRGSQLAGGSPGIENFSSATPLATVAINEITAAQDAIVQVELFNHGDATIQLRNLILGSTSANSPEYLFPDFELPPQDYLVLDDATMGFRPKTGDPLFLYTPNKSRVVDAVRFSDIPQARRTEGIGTWLVPKEASFGTPNRFAVEDAIVINEIMYHAYPIRSADSLEDNPEEWIELYNRSENRTIEMAGWSLAGGIAYEFPDDLQIGPGQYLVIARDVETLQQKYPSIADSIVGDFSGELSNSNDLVQLLDARGNPADQLHYFDGGRWPQYADSGGSSLELRDPHADNSRAETWAASDETTKSQWQSFTYQGIATEDGIGVDNFDEFVAGLLTAGEVLLDDISVVENPGTRPTELMQNGDFQEDTVGTIPAKWRLVGNHGIHGKSLVVPDPDDPSNLVLHVVATGQTRHISNHLETTLVAGGPQSIESDRVWSVDLQGLANGVARGMSGADSRVGVGEIWNHLGVDVHPGVGTNSAIENLHKGNGSPSGVDFSIAGTVSGFASGSEALVDDSIFVRAGNADPSVTWQISGLNPAVTYQLYALGGDVRFREAQLTIDSNGDGDLSNDTLVKVNSDGFHFANITADPTGSISGLFSGGNWAGFHLIQGELESPLIPATDGPLVKAGNDYRISFRAKWLAGSDQLNTRLYFNWVQKTTLLSVPTNNGTPAARNSQFQSNVGPTFSSFRHDPVVPAPSEDVTVAVTTQDPDNVKYMTLWYRVQSGPWMDMAMTGDGNGLYKGTIPHQRAGRNVQFYVAGQDSLGATSFFPADGLDSRAMYEVDDGRADLSLKHNIRIILNPSDMSLLYTDANRMSNDRMGATVIYDEQTVFYDVGVRLKGSPFGRNELDDEVSGFSIKFHPDHLFRGVHETISLNRGTPKEMFADHMYNNASGGLVTYYHDFAHVISPRSSETGTAVLAMARLSDVYLDSQFDNGNDGQLFNLDLLFLPVDTLDRNPEGPKRHWPVVDILGDESNFEIRDLGDDEEAYRWVYLLRNNRALDDYSRLIELAKAFELTGTALEERMEEIMDVDQWMRTFAMQALMGNGDDYPGIAQHNFRIYQRPSDNKMLALPWDIDGSFNRPTNDELWPRGLRASHLVDPARNTRLLYGHLWDIINTTFNPDYMTRWAEHFGDLGGPDYRGRTNYDVTILDYITERSRYVLTQLPEQIPFEITSIQEDSNGIVTLRGKGWIDVREVRLAGTEDALPIHWLDGENWEWVMEEGQADTSLTLEAYGHQGQLVGSDTALLSNDTIGDFDGDNAVGASDIDLIYAEVRNGTNASNFDLTHDGIVDQSDVDELVLTILGTRYGDIDLDGDVDQRDFAELAARFGLPQLSWSDGDLDGDGEVSFRDFNLLANSFGFGQDGNG